MEWMGVVAKVSLGPSQKVLFLFPKSSRQSRWPVRSAVRPFLTHSPSTVGELPLTSEAVRATNPNNYCTISPSTRSSSEYQPTHISHIQNGDSPCSGCRRCHSRLLRTPLRHRLCARTILTSYRVALVLSHCADTVVVPTPWAKHFTRVDLRRR